MSRLAFASAALVSAALAGCSSERLADPVRTGEANNEIIDGTLDTTHQAVVAVLGDSGECSGTIVAVNGSTGYVLTAAHCTTEMTPKYIVQGNDYNSSSAIVYNVESFKGDPSYNQQVYDFGMVKFSGADSSTPIIPAMQPFEDNLAVGSTVTIVGYGLTQNGQTSHRYEIDMTLDQQVTSLLLEYSQTNGGPCNGDSGGPALKTVNGQLRVAGVTSFGDQNCSQFGASGRTSAAYASFIQPYITGTTGSTTQTCDQCAQAATSGTGPCSSEVSDCQNDADCSAYAQCASGCSTNACIDNCATQHSAGAAVYDKIVNCVCTNACTTECTAQCQTTSGSGSTSSGSGTTATGTGGDGAGGSDPGTGGGGSAPTTETKAHHASASQDSGGCSVQGAGESAPASPALLAVAALGLAATRRRRRDRG